MGRRKQASGKGSARQHGGAAVAPGLARIYEGPEMLGKLLEKAGASVDVRGLVDRFRQAIAADELPSEAIPKLFPKEPRFGGAGDAMRFYANVLGVWDLLTAGVDPEELLAGPVTPEAEAEEAAEEEGPGGVAVELPERGSAEGTVVPWEVTEGIWQLLADLPPRERTRRQDRYANVQPELAEWARTVEGLGPAAQELLEYLCFELAEMFDHAFADCFGAVRIRELLQADGDEAERLQPYATDYAIETLEEAEESEEEAISAEEIALLDGYVRRAIVAMTKAVRP